jgi:O-antigen/teichoic acid export membrane protein
MSRPFAAEPGRRWLAYQLRRPFVRDAGVLQIGAFATLGVNFLLSVGLARMLGRDSYGAYALVISTTTTISLFKRLGQDYVATTDLSAAYARRDARGADRALVAFNVINIWSTLLVIPIALLVAPAIMGWFFKDEALAEPLRLALLPPLWAMSLATLVVVLQSSRRVLALTLVENSNNLALGAAALAMVLAGGKVSGVFLGQAVASLVFAALAVGLYRRVQSDDPLLPTLRALWVGFQQRPRAVWREFRSGLAVALDKNLVSLYPLSPILLLGSLAPTDQVALLRVAMSYVAVPLVALGAVSRLLMVKFPELHARQPERVRRFYLQVTAIGGLASITLTIPFVLLAPWLIGLLYGPDFVPASHLVPLLAIDPLLAGIGIAAGPIFRTYARNIWAVYANVAVLTLGLPCAYVLIQSHGLEGAALAYAGLVTTLRLAAYVLCLKIASQKDPCVS